MNRILRGLLIIGILVLIGIGGGFLAVRLFVQKERVTAPNLIGHEVSAVAELLNKRGLRLQVMDRITSTVVPANHVVKQDPMPGEPLTKGDTIRVILSSGISEASVPEIRGESLYRARRLLTENGLNSGEIVYIPSKTVAADHVIAQSPLPGQTLPKGNAVNMIVSSGKRKVAYVMPDLRGGTLVQTQELLKKWGLKLGDMRYTEQITGKPGTVVAQSPPPGARIEEGAPVALTLVPPGEMFSRETEGKFALLRYRVPFGPTPQRIQIIVRDREVFNQMQEPGTEVRLLIPVLGETVAQIYSNGTLVEEQRIR